MKGEWKNYSFGELVTFDKRFKGIDRAKQKNIVTFKHVSAELLKSLLTAGGDVKLLATGLFDGYTTIDKAANNLNEGEVITIPTGGNANIKYHKGLFVDSGNILAVSKSEDIYLKYIWYYLLYRNEYLESCFRGTGIKHPYMPDIWELKIPVPPFSEQQRIVERLDAEFARIDEIKANTEQQLQVATHLFYTALEDILTPQKGWVSEKVRNFANVSSGFAFKSNDFLDSGLYQVIRMGNVRPGVIRYNVSPVFIASNNIETIQKSILNEGDIIITLTGSRHKRDYGYTALIERNNLLLNQRLARIRVKSKVKNKFLLYYTWTETFKDQFFANEGGTVGQGNVGIDAIRDNIITYPSSLNEQETIVTILDNIHANCIKMESNYDKTLTLCNDLKQAFLKSIFE